MKYHYFVDFHTAIIEKVMEGFHPRLLVVINSIFALLFAYSLYFIAFYITNNKKAAIYAGIIGVFGAGFSYFLFFQDLFCFLSLWKKFPNATKNLMKAINLRRCMIKRV